MVWGLIVGAFVVWAVYSLASVRKGASASLLAPPAPSPPAPASAQQSPTSEELLFNRLHETAKKIFREHWKVTVDTDFVANLEDPDLLAAAKEWVAAEHVDLTYQILKRIRAGTLSRVAHLWLDWSERDNRPLPPELLAYLVAERQDSDIAVYENMTGDEYYGFKHHMMGLKEYNPKARRSS